MGHVAKGHGGAIGPARPRGAVPPRGPMPPGAAASRLAAWVVAALALGSVAIAGCGEATQESVPLLDLGPLPTFTLTERSGREVGLDELRGHVWLASFIYTRCQGPCPLITAAMASLQARLPEEVRLVSFSVDPVWDTPEELSEYARRWDADPQRWLFLTGEKESIRRLVHDGFHLAIAETGGAPSDHVTHSTRIAVVDREGEVRGAFDALDEGALGRIRGAVRRLLVEGSP